ncbi:MAG TPA: cytochrome c [Gammaproteobacteria bacterium]|nr:cytochrome c [Gammaproteobacteria bacterium]
MRVLLFFAGFLIMTSGFAATPAVPPLNPEADPAAGQIKATTCIGCHGIPSYDNAYPTYNVPKIAGQQEAYIIAALKSYKAGTRQHATMHAQAASLSEQDMADIAAYLSQLGEVPAEKADPASAPEAAAVCGSCHGLGGISTIPANPILAGQYPDYLEHALKAYKNGGRENAIMKTFASQLTEAEIKALAHWYSQQPSPLETIPHEGTPF